MGPVGAAAWLGSNPEADRDAAERVHDGGYHHGSDGEHQDKDRYEHGVHLSAGKQGQELQGVLCKCR